MFRLLMRALLLLQLLGAGEFVLPGPRPAAHACCCGDSAQAMACAGACECACGAAMAGGAPVAATADLRRVDPESCSLVRGTCGRPAAAVTPSVREPFERPAAPHVPRAVLERGAPPARAHAPAPHAAAPSTPPPRA